MTRERSSLTKITGDVGLRNAQHLAQTLRDALAGKADVCLDVAGVTVADITTAQLLLAARRQAAASGRQVTLAAPPQGALHLLLSQAGFLDPGGKPQTPEAEFWSPDSPKNKGKAA